MTYCLGIKLNSGLVLASDSRTHAGVDQVSVYSKMFEFKLDGNAYFILLAAGNLGVTQEVVNCIKKDIEDKKAKQSLATIKYFFEAADYIGSTSTKIQKKYRDLSEKNGNTFEASFILGGQVAHQAPDLVQIYPEGNYISVSPTHPYVQIGETKYGKPILDRIITLDTPLYDAARCALVSIDSTMRSNLSVGPPLELAVYENNKLALSHRLKLEVNSDYFKELRRNWGRGLKEIFSKLPRFDWE